jgi:phosphohistidine phosphatase
MRWLTLVRHAQAAPATAGGRDFDRPLTGAGIAEARQTAAALKPLPPVPDLLLASAAVRTRETATLLQELAFPGVPLVTEPALYGADVDTLQAYLKQLDEKLTHVLLVGHNPGISDLCTRLAAANRATGLGTADWRRFERTAGRWTGLR